MAAALLQVPGQQARDFVNREILEGQQIFLHADWVANYQTVAGWNRSNSPVFRNPVRPPEHLPVVQHEVAIVRQREARKTKTTAGAKPVCPSSQHFLQVMVHEWVFEHVAGSVGN